jgi:hypothetical protein
MIIQIDPALPCAQYLAGVSPSQLCGAPAIHAIITPDGDGTWEMLPVCSDHLQEASASLPHDSRPS